MAFTCFVFLLACKTSQPTIQGTNGEKTREELLQSKVDTNSHVYPIPIKISEATLYAHKSATLFCKMKGFDDKDMSDKQVAEDYNKLNQEYLRIQNNINKMPPEEKLKYESIFNKEIKKCNKN